MKIRLKFKCHCRRSVEWSSSRSQSLRQQSTSDVTWLILNPFVNGHLAPTHGLQKLIAIRQMLTVLLRPVLSPSSCQNVGVEGLARKLQKKLTPFAPPLNSNNKLYTTGQVCHIDSWQRDDCLCFSEFCWLSFAEPGRSAAICPCGASTAELGRRMKIHTSSFKSLFTAVIHCTF